MESAEIQADPAFDSTWYYTLELAAGLLTAGRDHWAVAQTRDLLRRADVESGGGGAGARCLDVGIQEGLVSILLERRGAAEVVGYDRVLRRRRLGLVQRALGTGLELVGGVRLQELPEALGDRAAFDIVVFSGVLYHMFDPFGGLVTVRGLVRNGGICIVETAVVFDDSDALHFNTAGRLAPYALWFITPRLLDYLLRFVRLKPIDVVYLGEPEASRRGLRRLVPGRRRRDGAPPRQGRIAVACRAMPNPVAVGDDEWIGGAGIHDLDFAEFLDWDKVASDAPDVGYDAAREGIVHRGDGSVDLEASIAATEPLPLRPEQAMLTLAARY